MDLKTAQRYADKICTWLEPYALRLGVAGSIRRQRPFCADIDIVCIPKITADQDLLGAQTDRTNLCLGFLQRYVQMNQRPPVDPQSPQDPATSLASPRFLSGGEREGKQVILQLPKCQLDLWFADESTWATRMLCRTGSKEHNIWLCTRANERGFHWDPYTGLRTLSQRSDPDQVYPAGNERDIYNYLGLEFIEPKNRELEWLTKHIDSGLLV